MKMSKRTSMSGIPYSRWGDPGLPDARGALYQLMRGEREALFRADGCLDSWQERNPVRNKTRFMAQRLGLKVSINWVGSIKDKAGSRTVWQITRMTG